MANYTAIARKQSVFVMKETTKGTLVAPTDDGLVIVAGMASLNQQPSFTNSSNIRNSRDILERFQDKTPPASWSLPIYITPSGVAGTAPQEDVLLESLMGAKTINASTSVVYSPALTKPSFSLWIKKDHTVFHCSGCTVGSGKFALATKDGAKIDMSGQGMKMGWAGTDATSSLVAESATSIPVVDAKKYTVGAFVEFVESDVVKNNTDAGYEITAVNTDTNTLTIAYGVEEEIASGSIVRGWLPEGAEIGTPLSSRKGYAQIDSNEFPVQSMDCSISDSPKYLEDEITQSGYVEDYAETERSISGTVKLYYRQDDVGYFDDGLNDISKELDMVVGDTAGSIVEINQPNASLSVPSVEESDPTVALSIPYVGLGTSGEDSISITYK